MMVIPKIIKTFKALKKEYADEENFIQVYKFKVANFALCGTVMRFGA